MHRYLRRFGLIALLGAAVPAAIAAPQKRNPVAAHIQSTVPAPMQQAPMQPAPVQQTASPTAPVSPPQVTFTDGLLTISAPNSTLADILNAVKAQTGATLEIPPSAEQERVVVQLGPGQPREVLSQLLDGSPFDYILLGSPDQPNALTQIILTPHARGGTTAASVQKAPQGPPPPQPADEDSDNEPAAQTPQPIPGPPMPPEQTQPPAEPAPPNGPPANRVKTPEQLLQELQQLQRQEQQRRQEQQQNRPPQ